MITSSPSPTVRSSSQDSSSTLFTGRSQYDGVYKPASTQASSARACRLYASSSTTSASFSPRVAARLSSTSLHRRFEDKDTHANDTSSRGMVDASTQYSPPTRPALPDEAAENPSSRVTGLQLRGASPYQTDTESDTGTSDAVPKKDSQPQMSSSGPQVVNDSIVPINAKRSTSETQANVARATELEVSPLSKRRRPEAPAVRLMPSQYETCDPRDLVILISSMLMELVRYNDAIPLRDGHLTRFHSRAPPAISVLDYLQRLTTHATLSPPILLSMVYYIDKLCALYPAFTISSLTVHRFLITSATVASKGLSDSFWTNKTYARVGGVSLKELALLELEFLWRVEWRIVPKPEVLVDYYRSLVERSDEYRIDTMAKLDTDANGKSQQTIEEKARTQKG